MAAAGISGARNGQRGHATAGHLARRGCSGGEQVVGHPAQTDRHDQAGSPGHDLNPPPARRSLDRGPAAQRFKGRRESPGWGELGQESGGPVPQCRDGIPGGLARRTGGEMAFDLDTLGPAQPLVEIGVQLLLRNVPHGSPWMHAAAGHAPPPDAAEPAPAWCPLPQGRGRSGPRSPGSSARHPTGAESPGRAVSG